MASPSPPADPVDSPKIDDWVGPSRRARALAAMLAVAIAVVTFFVVNRLWHFYAPPPAPPPKPSPVEVQLVPQALPPAPPRR